jgi:RING finger/CHY zinc finger protein 1
MSHTSSSEDSMDVDTFHDSNEFHQERVVEAERRHSHMTLDEEKERRASIKDIMQDPQLTPLEKRLSVQSLMDGRRRSSTRISGGPMSMAAAAAAAAAEFYDSSDDEMMDDSLPHESTATTQHSNSTSSSSTLLAPVPTTRPRYGRSASLRSFGAVGAAAAAAATLEVSYDAEDITNTSKRMEKSRPPCNHYQRKCTIVSPCCGLAFGCRICHDECPVLPNPIVDTTAAMESSRSNTTMSTAKRRRSLPIDLDQQPSHHVIDRFLIKEIICRECFTRQSSKTNKCVSCGIQFGIYHCERCNLWMSDEEEPYHCHDCGFCRVGGRANFKHCHDCDMCIDAQYFHDHNCKAGKYMSNCPVCQEDLFSSRSASHEMPCGHAIHWHCFKELTSYDTRCPVCKKTAETREHMAATWSAMAMGISLQPVPPEMARVVTIICNDCEEVQKNRQWHFLGVQCLACSSFNTIVEKITLMGREAVGVGISPPPPPPRQQQQQQQDGDATSPQSLDRVSFMVGQQQPVIDVDDSSGPENMDQE